MVRRWCQAVRGVVLAAVGLGLMVARDDDVQAFPSTTWAWKKVRVGPAPQAHSRSATKSLRWRSKARRDMREPITLTIRYRGGPECWVEVVGRGETNRYPGYTALYDLVKDINSQW